MEILERFEHLIKMNEIKLIRNNAITKKIDLKRLKLDHLQSLIFHDESTRLVYFPSYHIISIDEIKIAIEEEKNLRSEYFHYQNKCIYETKFNRKISPYNKIKKSVIGIYKINLKWDYMSFQLSPHEDSDNDLVYIIIIDKKIPRE